MFYVSGITSIRCYFASLGIYIFLYFETFVSDIHFIHQIVIVQIVWHFLSLRSNLFVLARRITEARLA